MQYQPIPFPIQNWEFHPPVVVPQLLKKDSCDSKFSKYWDMDTLYSVLMASSSPMSHSSTTWTAYELRSLFKILSPKEKVNSDTAAAWKPSTDV